MQTRESHHRLDIVSWLILVVWSLISATTSAKYLRHERTRHLNWQASHFPMDDYLNSGGGASSDFDFTSNGPSCGISRQPDSEPSGLCWSDDSTAASCPNESDRIYCSDALYLFCYCVPVTEIRSDSGNCEPALNSCGAQETCFVMLPNHGYPKMVGDIRLNVDCSVPYQALDGPWDRTPALIEEAHTPLSLTDPLGLVYKKYLTFGTGHFDFPDSVEIQIFRADRSSSKRSTDPKMACPNGDPGALVVQTAESDEFGEPYDGWMDRFPIYFYERILMQSDKPWADKDGLAEVWFVAAVPELFVSANPVVTNDLLVNMDGQEHLLFCIQFHKSLEKRETAVWLNAAGDTLVGYMDVYPEPPPVFTYDCSLKRWRRRGAKSRCKRLARRHHGTCELCEGDY